MNTRFLDGFYSSTGQEVGNTTPNKRRAREVAIQEYRTKALLTSVATGFMGFSSGFAVQVMTRRYVPGFVTKNYIIPTLMAAYVSSRTYMHLLENEEKNVNGALTICSVQSDTETAGDSMIMS